MNQSFDLQNEQNGEMFVGDQLKLSKYVYVLVVTRAGVRILICDWSSVSVAD